MIACDERRRKISRLKEGPWDLLVIGGGVSGAGVAREAARQGWRVALIEQNDFASGASSRSSKLVHGGLRYLKQGQIGLMRESVRERERLMREAPELVSPQLFVMAHGPGLKPSRGAMGAALAVYDRMAGRKSSASLGVEDAKRLAPGWSTPGMTGASAYFDAQTDDARLVIRLLAEAERDGAVALNYVCAEAPLLESGRVVGVRAKDGFGSAAFSIRARTVVSATGPWADELRAFVGGGRMIRPLRGSHLVVPFWRLPIPVSISLMHPRDGRPVFFYPWEGAVLIGTTDLDHERSLSEEASITPEEVDYLLAVANAQLPGANIGACDILSSFAGVRPVVDEGDGDPSNAAREHVILDEKGLITLSGGKLTTFRAMAKEALALAAPAAGKAFIESDAPTLSPASPVDGHPRRIRRRLAARYGFRAREVAAIGEEADFETIPGTDTLWFELRAGARFESVVHLDDLLLRRTRIGLLTPRGGMDHEARIRVLVKEALGWSDTTWSAEIRRYREIISAHYSLPQPKIETVGAAA